MISPSTMARLGERSLVAHAVAECECGAGQIDTDNASYRITYGTIKVLFFGVPCLPIPFHLRGMYTPCCGKSYTIEMTYGEST